MPRRIWQGRHRALRPLSPQETDAAAHPALRALHRGGAPELNAPIRSVARLDHSWRKAPVEPSTAFWRIAPLRRAGRSEGVRFKPPSKLPLRPARQEKLNTYPHSHNCAASRRAPIEEIGEPPMSRTRFGVFLRRIASGVRTRAALAGMPLPTSRSDVARARRG